MKKSTYCLVLGGGGAKGVYHIGAWKALRELDVKVDAFIGNSIGAIIAGFLAQGEEKKLEEIASQIGLDFILNVPGEFIEDGEFKLSVRNLSGFKKLYQKTFTKKGLNTSPLQNLLKTNLDEEKIRKSGNDLGVVTYSLSDMKPKEMYIEDMEEGCLIDYILASSAFPGFEQPEIAGKKYIDGGVYDNIPYTMAQQRGYKRIIVVDISGFGVKRKLDVQGGQIIYIKNSINMGGILDFDREFLDNYIDLGYLDTLRTFDRLHGYNYFFIPNIKLEKRFNDSLRKSENQAKLESYAEEYFGKHQLALSISLKTIFPEYARFERQWLPVFCDCAATLLSIEKIRKWQYKDLFDELKARYVSLCLKVDELGQKDIHHIESVVKERIKEKQLVEAPYYYYLVIDRFVHGKAQTLLKKALFALLPELAAGNFFISKMEEFWNTDL